MNATVPALLSSKRESTIFTIFENCLPTASISLLAPYQEACRVSKVNISSFGMVVQRPWVYQVLDWNHVFIARLYVYIQATDYSRTALSIEEEEVILGLCNGKDIKIVFFFNSCLLFCFKFAM